MTIQSGYSFCSPITPFSCLMVINLWWDCVLVPRLLWQINMVSDLTTGRSSNLSKTRFLIDLAWKLSNSSKIQHCTRSQGLPLNTPSKELGYQAFLIDYARCDESLKCAGYLTLHCPFCCDFQVFNRWKHSLQQIQMASSIDILTPFNFHSSKGDMEI